VGWNVVKDLSYCKQTMAYSKLSSFELLSCFFLVGPKINSITSILKKYSYANAFYDNVGKSRSVLS
jgi:hypothetical protein